MDRSRCAVQDVWCGKPGGVVYHVVTNDSTGFPKIYTRKGTPDQCLRKGVGAGKYAAIKDSLPHNSLRKIKYVTEDVDSRLRGHGISTVSQLRSQLSGMTRQAKRTLLRDVTRTNTRAYNSLILYLDTHGVTNLPACS